MALCWSDNEKTCKGNGWKSGTMTGTDRFMGIRKMMSNSKQRERPGSPEHENGSKNSFVEFYAKLFVLQSHAGLRSNCAFVQLACLFVPMFTGKNKTKQN